MNAVNIPNRVTNRSAPFNKGNTKPQSGPPPVARGSFFEHPNSGSAGLRAAKPRKLGPEPKSIPRGSTAPPR